MIPPGGLRDLLPFCAQGLVLTFAAAATSRILPIDRPAYRLAWWQAVLLASLVLPLLGAAAAGPGQVALDWEIPHGVSRLTEIAGVSVPWSQVAAATLVCGLVIRVARLLRGVARLRACRRRAIAFDVAGLGDLEQMVGVRADVRVSPDLAVPATFGLRRPLVLLPQAVRDMPIERQRAIVAHELIHVRRRDWTTTVAEEALAAALWFHPAVSFLIGRIRLAREQCVDAAVIDTIGGRRVYLESLLEVAKNALRPAPVPAALFLGERHLSARVELLLKEVVMSKARACSHLTLGAALLMATGALAATAFPLALSGDADKESKPTAEAKAKLGEPRLVHKVAPAYPLQAKQDHVQGVVHVDARLAKDGAVAEAKAIDGHATLAEAAVAAIRQWRYEPVLGPDKTPVEARLTITINFRLD